MTDIYRGSLKHKRRPAMGRKGTLCPEWTHTREDTGEKLGLDPADPAFNWLQTPAGRLFGKAEIDEDSGRRFATERGIAFEAKPTNDGSWHGYPIPWDDVPADVKDKLVTLGNVKGSMLRRHASFSETIIDWAMDTDEH
ncbi:hypothetical protein LHP98_19010 [Rhodobacter sp. Har01]|uniref:hypothetical protein n=1 Tax=Rhodobacter sp. Har01 TaxID=2883999 RepID=UPI001D089E1B|nr:hypothetical protein [Rhodobacter sp. Har01]MCB6180206.1 hypothetical protein [Rhodobacter sp. Har01]